ncbi:GFA family protein [Devosia sp. FKR38]|uniref:GFA family protein n=1 Tax=Devosia sp. FKR38 TaxID=2562312 RepID=UPI0010BFAA26|nr:GFA family protein [Devosia sp. FKR38]
MTDSQTYDGQCHCGAVRFSVHTDLSGPSACNCSHCRRLGWIMQSVPAENFTLLSDAEALTLYRFNTHTIDHLFCRHCGIQSFARGSDGKGKSLVMINVNCLEPAVAVDPAAIKHWDGANW